MAEKLSRTTILLALILKWTTQYKPNPVKDLADNGMSRADAEKGIQTLVKDGYLQPNRKAYDPKAKSEYLLNTIMILNHPRLFYETLVLTGAGETRLAISRVRFGS